MPARPRMQMVIRDTAPTAMPATLRTGGTPTGSRIAAASRIAAGSWLVVATAAALFALALGYASLPAASGARPQASLSRTAPASHATDAAFMHAVPSPTGTTYSPANAEPAANVPLFTTLPAWSPDGKMVAFLRPESDRPNVWNVWLLTVSTGETRRVTSFRYGQTGSASWFPDGRRLAYSHEDRLVIRDVSSGAARELASPVPNRRVRAASVSPDGRRVIFQVTGSGAWLLDVDTAAMRCVSTDPGAEEFAWAPDGRGVTYRSRRDAQWRLLAIGAPDGVTG